MGDFSGAGQAAGLEVWRIEDKVSVPVPKKMYGQFYEGDSYICLKTTQKPKSSSLNWDLFFWLGSESSQDEQGIAAYKTVELDEELGGAAVQHRETQGHESDLFMQSFTAVRYLKGGVASGFNHVERDAYETRLLQLKGARMVRVSVVPLNASSLNAGDVFVLDMGLSIIQWNGSEANRKEKAKALSVCLDIKDNERGGKATITACDQGAEPEDFWKALGGRGAVAPAVSDDEAALVKTAPKLLQVSDASGALVTSQVAGDVLDKAMLSTKDVFILDIGAEIYVWVGKEATSEERRAGMDLGNKYVAEAARPKGTRVSKVMEGTEPTVFKSNFAKWEEVALPTPGDFTPRGNIAVKRTSSANLGNEMVEALMTPRGSAEEIDDGSGKTDVYRVEGFEKVAIDESMHGQFFAGDSYIVLYTYTQQNKQRYIIYFWLGAQSSQDEKGAAAILVTKMDDELGGAATQVRVAMGKEPAHFVTCFHGKMVVHSGGKASGFKNKAEKDEYDADGVSLFHVRGTGEEDTRAVQVEEKATSLNSGDCFVLLTPSTMYVWLGSGSNDTEQVVANKVATTMQAKRAVETVAEGSEPEAFWSAIGGKAEYPSSKVLSDASREPMLFHLSNSTGRTVVEPVYDFSQVRRARRPPGMTSPHLLGRAAPAPPIPPFPPILLAPPIPPAPPALTRPGPPVGRAGRRT